MVRTEAPRHFLTAREMVTLPWQRATGRMESRSVPGLPTPTGHPLTYPMTRELPVGGYFKQLRKARSRRLPPGWTVQRILELGGGDGYPASVLAARGSTFVSRPRRVRPPTHSTRRRSTTGAPASLPLQVRAARNGADPVVSGSRGPSVLRRSCPPLDRWTVGTAVEESLLESMLQREGGYGRIPPWPCWRPRQGRAGRRIAWDSSCSKLDALREPLRSPMSPPAVAMSPSVRASHPDQCTGTLSRAAPACTAGKSPRPAIRVRKNGPSFWRPRRRARRPCRAVPRAMLDIPNLTGKRFLDIGRYGAVQPRSATAGPTFALLTTTRTRWPAPGARRRLLRR